MRPFGKYLLVQIPGWLLVALALGALRYWFDLPLWAVAGGFVLWVAKDLALYSWVRPSYEPGDERTGAERLIGARGVVRQTLDPAGYVHVRGELWRAETLPGAPPIPAGVSVEVRGARGLTLLVSPPSEGRGDAHP